MSLRLLSSVFWRKLTLGREYNNTIRLGFAFIYKTRVASASENMTWSSTLRQPNVQVLGPRQDIELKIQKHSYINNYI